MAGVSIHITQGVVTCTLDNGQRRNALTVGMLAILIEALKQAQTDSTLRAVVVRGANGTFCSGRDLSELDAQRDHRPSPEDAIAPVTQLARAMHACPVPTLAVVEGKAVGLGVALASWCDMVIATDSALFSIPEARAGVPPTFTAVSLAQTLGQRRALSLCLTGRPLSATQAQSFGLAHFVFPDADFEAQVQNLVQDLLKGGPNAQRHCKALLGQVGSDAFDAAIQLAQRAAIDAMGSAESQEGIQAFKEKRPPAWYKGGL